MVRVVDLVDTSVFAAFIQVPGRDAKHDEVRAEFERRVSEGVTFILPVSTIIETGNMIANGSGDRHSAAKRFVRAIEMAREQNAPWTIRDVEWDFDFLQRFLDGAATDNRLVNHLTAGTLGAGDMAILVERDRLMESTSNTHVRVWTFDNELHAQAGT